jgi:3-hydroxyisobutyrate dehydrogenase-like beta-hydroxyacid dehydrogenase
VQGAERIHLSLSDDASVDAVLEPLAGVLPAGAWVVDHTTTAVHLNQRFLTDSACRGGLVSSTDRSVAVAFPGCASGAC